MNEARTPGSVFNAVQLGYLVIESARLDAWRQFGEEALGMELAQRDERLLAFRMDDHQRRIMVQTGGAEDVVAIGWQLRDQAALDTVLARLRWRQIAVTPSTPEQARARGVAQFWQCTGPKGLQIELFTNPLLNDAPLRMRTSAFVTGAAGMGHVAITSRRPAAMLAFWNDIFDARHSDDIEAHISGLTLDIRFLRVNERHHSIAVACTRGRRMDPIRTRIQHFNVQAATLDDLSAAYVRCRKLGFPIALGMGQHTNDKELSFYVRSPSGFEIEFGWQPIAVDEHGWQPAVHQGISIWGHKPQQQTLGDKLGELGRALRSLLGTEFMPNGF
ncbi:VOC family protein [Rugamonas apoptosis]|uniref:VOC family protein n=1 Tax=Rugamonas apoptosis TaxID=2758570 RepID=A0A7W2FDT3_9BURK|nr:VOC family protein [Rugamonas apoptosis]MBA5689893.1 VOC family protein [Rugamonas apoptosis]